MPGEKSAPCPSCGAAMDETASYCPTCRAPRSGVESGGGSRIGLAMLIVVIVGGIVGTILKVAGVL